MINSSGWFDWAIKDEGPLDRQNYYGQDNNLDCIIHHSLEGYYNGVGTYASFRDPSRYPTLWHGTIRYDGSFYQHCPIQKMTVHAHSGNLYGPGFESEGFSNQPLTSEQVKTWLRIHSDIAEFTGKEYSREDRTLAEHRDFASTQCPSERYAPLWKAIEEGKNEMASNEYVEIMKLLFGENYEARVEELRGLGVLPIESRVSRFESNTGPIGVRLTDLETGLISVDAGLTALEVRHGMHTGDESVSDD